MPIVWSMPDGSVQVTQILDAVVERERRAGETTAQVVTRLGAAIQAKTPSLATGVPTLVVSANMPATRAKRNGWRLSGATVVEDDTVLQAAQTAERQRVFDDQKLIKAVALWAAQKLGVAPATAKTEILTIYRGL